MKSNQYFTIALYDSDGMLQQCEIECSVESTRDAYSTGDSPTLYEVYDVKLLSEHNPEVDIYSGINNNRIDSKAIQQASGG